MKIVSGKPDQRESLFHGSPSGQCSFRNRMTARKLAERKIAAQTPTMPLPSTRHSPITENETRQLDMIRSSRITSRVDSLKSREVTPRGASRGQKGNGRRRNTGVKPLEARRRVGP